MTEVKLATRPYGLPIRVLLPALLTLLLPGPPCAAEEREAAALAFFEQRIRPLLIERCHKCHGASKQRSRLRLDSLHAALRGGESGPAIVPGSPEKSRLIHAIQYREKLKMQLRLLNEKMKSLQWKNFIINMKNYQMINSFYTRWLKAHL